MKNKIYKPRVAIVIVVMLLLGCNGSHSVQGNGRSMHNRGVNNRSYRGY